MEDMGMRPMILQPMLHGSAGQQPGSYMYRAIYAGTLFSLPGISEATVGATDAPIPTVPGLQQDALGLKVATLCDNRDADRIGEVLVRDGD